VILNKIGTCEQILLELPDIRFIKILSEVLKLFHAQTWTAGAILMGTPGGYKHG
jgi:hypothetical protein